MLVFYKGNTTWRRESPKALITTLFWKQYKGTRLIIVPNGKKIKDDFFLRMKWTIRHREPTNDMEVYGSGSTTAKVWV
jgi:hypothetical protein